jgi:hypothetical protein
MSRAGRPPRPAWGWRLLAWTALVTAGLMSLPTLPSMGVKGWLLAAVNWIAIGGTLSYAYGLRPRSLWFWRFFALPFSVYTVGTLGMIVGRAIAYVRFDPRPTPVSGWILIAATLLMCISVCVALLRHAELLRARQRSAIRDLEAVFA